MVIGIPALACATTRWAGSGKADLDWGSYDYVAYRTILGYDPAGGYQRAGEPCVWRVLQRQAAGEKESRFHQDLRLQRRLSLGCGLRQRGR